MDLKLTKELRLISSQFFNKGQRDPLAAFVCYEYYSRKCELPSSSIIQVNVLGGAHEAKITGEIPPIIYKMVQEVEISGYNPVTASKCA